MHIYCGSCVDFIDGKLSVLRRCRVDTRLPWNGVLRIGRDLGANSLEVLALATGFSEMLHLHRSGIENYLLALRRIENCAVIAPQSLRQFSSELGIPHLQERGHPEALYRSRVVALARGVCLGGFAARTAAFLQRRAKQSDLRIPVYSAVAARARYGRPRSA